MKIKDYNKNRLVFKNMIIIQHYVIIEINLLTKHIWESFIWLETIFSYI